MDNKNEEKNVENVENVDNLSIEEEKVEDVESIEAKKLDNKEEDVKEEKPKKLTGYDSVIGESGALDPRIQIVAFFQDSFKVNKRLGRRDYWVMLLQVILLSLVFCIFPPLLLLLLPGCITMGLRRYVDLGLAPWKTFLLFFALALTLGVVFPLFSVLLQLITYVLPMFASNAFKDTAPDFLKYKA